MDWTEVSIGVSALLIFLSLVTKLVNQFIKVHQKAWQEHRIERGEWREAELKQREKTDAVVNELAEVIRDSSKNTDKTLQVLNALHSDLKAKHNQILK
jgi:hypothetical protein